jgi:hypothetical protein
MPLSERGAGRYPRVITPPAIIKPATPPRDPVRTPPPAPAPAFNPYAVFQKAISGSGIGTTRSAPKAAKPYVAPAPSRSPSSGGSSGGGGGGGGSSSGGGGGDSGGGGGGGGGFAAPAPVMETITIPDAEADENYKRTVGDLARARADFQAQQGLARNQYDFGWNDAKRRMGWDQTAGKFDRARPGAYGESVSANENDFAGRGMLRSGAYVQTLGDIDRDFNDRRSGLDTARNDNVNTQAQALSSFGNSQESTKQAALTDAVSRIASKYGIDLSAVPKGTTSTIERQVI